MKRTFGFLMVMLALGLAGCSDDDTAALGGPGASCADDSECQEGLICVDGVCAASAVDTDGDGIVDSSDNCPAVFNPQQIDSDGDGIGDECEPDIANDSDDDQVEDDADNCPNVPNPDQTDTDGDGQGDACDDDDDDDGIDDDSDNCPLIANPDQADQDNDGKGDVCDDDDGDGVTDDTDNCPDVSNPNQNDSDMDGIGDACDDDRDGDNVDNDQDNCPDVSNPDQADEDEDGQGDACDPDTTRRSGRMTDTSCTYSAPVGMFAPSLEWSLGVGMNDPYPDRSQVMMTPAVANLTDDNADGSIDTMDVPDVIFTTFATNNNTNDWDQLQYGVLRAASGDGSGLLWSVGYNELGLSSGDGIQPAGSIAVADIDNDGTVEIIAGLWNDSVETGGLVAINHDGSVLWSSSYEVNGVQQPRQFKFWWGGPSIADIDGDGDVEIAIGATVFDHTGALVFDGTDASGLTGPAGEGINWAAGDSNNTIYTGTLSLLADLDGTLDATSGQTTLELVTGRTAYNADGSVLWEADATLADGFPAVGDFDGDQDPEIVVSADGTVRIHDGLTGDVVWGPVELNAGRLGAPTVADFTGDGFPEIGVAGRNSYFALSVDLANPSPSVTEATLWRYAMTRDQSSNMTGSSVFDFEGDGKAEVVYNDELYLRVFDGETGAVLFEEPNNSFTALEYPIIVDIDNDGAAEIVVSTNSFECGDQLSCVGSNTSFSGLQVFGDAQDNWVATRRIWNQHTYHINNVNEDGTVPAQEVESWTDHNSYRLNAQTTVDPTAAPDLIIEDTTVQLDGCLAVIRGWVTNAGAERVGAALDVSFYADDGSGRVYLGTSQTQLPLEPGQSERVELRTMLPAGGPYTFILAADDSGPNTMDSKRECNEDNNEGEVQDSGVCEN